MKICLGGLLVFFLTCYSGQVLSQQNFITLRGRITDAQTGQPLPFVNIQLKSGTIGTATNTEGEFIFKIPQNLSTDTLLVSSIGYKTVEKPLKSLGLSISVALQPAVVELAEVTVNADTGLDMIKKAIDRIPVNYDTSNVQLTAFYRENLWLDTLELSFAETVVDIYKIFKADKKLNDQIRVIKGRKKNIHFSGKDAQLYYWISGISNGPRGSLGNDLVKYHKSDFSPFNPGNFRYYNYDYSETIHEGDRDLAVIDIAPKNKSRKALLQLRAYLDEASFAIVKYDYETTEAGTRRTERKDKGVAYAIMSTVVGATADYHKFLATVTYKQYHGKWYLNTVTRHWEILLSSKKRNMVNSVWRADMDFIVTDVNTKSARPINTDNIGDKEGSIKSFIGNDQDESFWENYNVLKSVSADSIQNTDLVPMAPDTVKTVKNLASNRQNGFNRGDTLRGKLTPLRTCYDVTFYHLDVAVDMDERSVKGNNTIRFNVDEPFRKIQVDLYENMAIDKIIYKNKPLAYTREHNAVFVHFPEVLKRGTQAEIKIYYQGVPKTPDWTIPMNGGILWDKDSLGNPWAQVVCQGSGASLWWPNKDHQSDEPDSMKIWITVPSQFMEISNARLKRKTSLPDDRTRHEWYVSYPINNYNVTFNIGKYVHYTDYYHSDDTLTIDYYVMAYNLERSKKMFRQVKPMLECFEKNFGKYPFPRDGFTLVESLYPMEHQSGVCIGKITQENTGDTNPLLWHESAHEWWGNAITCTDIADMWIHEAFATYAEILVIEHRFGKQAAYDAILDQVEAVRNIEPVIGVYDVNHIYYDIGDMYSKGSLLLHTFRNVLDNDQQWTTLLRDIQDHFRYKTIKSDELIAYINLWTKTDYTYLFDQYLKYTDLPRLELQLEGEGSDLKIRYRWQANVQNFRMPVKVTTAPDRFEFIYPTPDWKTMTLKNITADDFEVDEEKFYIEVIEN
jgi:hypothetical protein